MLPVQSDSNISWTLLCMKAIVRIDLRHLVLFRYYVRIYHRHEPIPMYLVYQTALHLQCLPAPHCQLSHKEYYQQWEYYNKHFVQILANLRNQTRFIWKIYDFVTIKRSFGSEHHTALNTLFLVLGCNCIILRSKLFAKYRTYYSQRTSVNRKELSSQVIVFSSQICYKRCNIQCCFLLFQRCESLYSCS